MFECEGIYLKITGFAVKFALETNKQINKQIIAQGMKYDKQIIRIMNLVSF